jgi:predicted DNA-binding helix-hairpin-helix protein
VVKITLDFYKRNYIEGLFLSSGIIRSADHTMEMVIDVARKLREEHHFRGYIHLKTIPEASPALIEMAGRYADRISINIELPSEQSVATLAPEKNLARTQDAMAHIRQDRRALRGKNQTRRGETTAFRHRPEHPDDRRRGRLHGLGHPPPRGHALHGLQAAPCLLLRLQPDPRALVAAADQSPAACPGAPALSGRLAAALLRLQGGRITTQGAPNLDLDLDPKLSWALRNRPRFRWMSTAHRASNCSACPASACANVERILGPRRFTRLRLSDLVRCGFP